MATHIVIEGETFPVDSTQEIRAARAAMIRAGVAEAPVWAGEAPDAVKTSGEVFASVPVLVSWNNGASTEVVTGDSTAAVFLERFGMQNVRALLRDHDLPTDYASELALIAALDTCCAEDEVLTLP